MDSDRPKRIQLSRKKGWRKPEGAIIVSRPSRWGNWYVVRRNNVVINGRYVGPGLWWIVVATDKRGFETGPHWGAWPLADKVGALTFAVELYRRSLDATAVEPDGHLNREFYLDGLRGHDLACWCRLDHPCHADVLLGIANA